MALNFWCLLLSSALSVYQHYFLKWDYLRLLFSFPMLLNPIFSCSLGLRLMLASGNVLRV